MRISFALVACLAACTFQSNIKGLGKSSSSSTSTPTGTSSSTSGSSGASSSSSEPPAEAASKCDAAHDHCLEKENWFALSFYESQEADKPIDAYPGLWVEKSTAGAPWIWGYRCDCTVGGYGVRAVVATRENIAVDRRVVVFYDDWGGKVVRLPKDEIEARKDEWRAGVVTQVDAAAGTFRMTSIDKPIPIAYARVVMEYRESVPERPQKFPLPFKDPAP
jgi:hypothetical protein